MDISALKGNLNSVPVSTPAPAPVMAPVANQKSDSQVVSNLIKTGAAVTSEVSSNDNKTDKKAVKIEDVQQMTDAMNHFLSVSNANMQVSLHEKTNALMVRFVDTKNGQVLKEFPSHEFLDTMANIREYVGILLDKKV